jgi:hypothetical protein
LQSPSPRLGHPYSPSHTWLFHRYTDLSYLYLYKEYFYFYYVLLMVVFMFYNKYTRAYAIFLIHNTTMSLGLF